MTFTATLIEPKLDVDRLAEQLAAFASFFAAQPKPADDDRGTDPRAEGPGRVDPVPGDPVDTSHHGASQSPVASAGAPDNRDPSKPRERSDERRD